MSRRSLSSAVALVGTAVLLAGCQSVDQDAIQAEAFACPEGSECYDEVKPIGPGGKLVVTTGEFFFDIQEGVAIDGPVTIELINEGDALHNFRIDAAAGDDKKVEANAGETVEGSLELFGGTEYTYYCDVPGHRGQGMEGFLTVYLDEQAAREEGAFEEGAGEEDGPGAGDAEGENPDVPAEDAEPEPAQGDETEVGPGNTRAPTEDDTEA
ncbi:MAG: hypothetical protein KY461_10960 [Actinobacteria bacterium]|nr:hypothetical protein [Actinomycetota bacterium]